MATAEECRTALEALAARLSEVDPQKRAAVLADRSLSCTVTDLGVTFTTKLGADGASPVTEAGPGDPPAQVRFSASSDELLAVSGDPKRFVRSWLTGKVKVEASLGDLIRLRKLL
jgi:hypothetical protein